MSERTRTIRLAVLLVIGVVAASWTHAARVRTTDESIVGDIVESGRDRVVVQNSRGRVVVPIGELRAILYDDEPAELSQARINAAGGGYENALERLDQLPAGKEYGEAIDREIAYLRATCAARLAILTGQGAGDAGRQLTAFLKQNSDSRFFYPAIETLADLLVAVGRTDTAISRYRGLVKSAPPTLRDRALVSIGRAYEQAGQHAEALAAYETAIEELSSESEFRRVAQLGRAVSLAASGQGEAGVRAARAAIESAGADPAQLAAAYNTLGRCLLAADSREDALYAFLHTDLVHNDDAATHAEALYHLAQLWRDIGRRREADDAAARLKRRYGRSKWAYKRPPSG